jgi:inner membrane transporter RhtA
MSTPETSAALPLAQRLPPQLFFIVSAVFHYLGPACAVLLFGAVEVLGVAWLRIATAALVFALWRRPWRLWRRSSAADRRTLLALGVVLAAMNACFYLAIARLPPATVGAIEFLGPIGLAAAGLRSRRNLVALGVAAAGVALLTQIRLEGDALGYVLAFANAALFVAYIVLAHRIAGADGIDGLAAAMLMALVAITPFGLGPALPALTDPALLPATAAGIGILVLGQIPSTRDLAGIALVMAGVALHRAVRA